MNDRFFGLFCLGVALCVSFLWGVLHTDSCFWVRDSFRSLVEERDVILTPNIFDDYFEIIANCAAFQNYI